MWKTLYVGQHTRYWESFKDFFLPQNSTWSPDGFLGEFFQPSGTETSILFKLFPSREEKGKVSKLFSKANTTFVKTLEWEHKEKNSLRQIMSGRIEVPQAWKGPESFRFQFLPKARGIAHVITIDMFFYPSILAWKLPWTQEPGGLLSIGL